MTTKVVTNAVVRVGVGVLVTSKLHPGCILLGKRKGSHGAGKFAAPGGHLELGESWEQCASREVSEETNLKLDHVRFVHCTNDANIGGDPLKHYITIFMTGIVSDDSPELINMEPHKCESWSWTPWEEVRRLKQESPEFLFEPMIHLVEGLPSNVPPSFL